MADTFVRYVRGDTFVENTQGAGRGNGTVAHGLVGKLWVQGLCFHTIERMDGYVCMAGDADYANSTMYWMSKYGSYVINPWLGREAEQTKRRNILFHPAGVPAHLEGCVGVGLLEGGRLASSRESLSTIWKQCGGSPGNKTEQITIALRVEGKMPSLVACKAWSG